ncbi:tetratricopeptide repeat protein [Flavobacterium sp. DG1-102-2]|uniref:tetratricopeptide repeat protein n=1 Tax=Flavobacterium sp. DG1-102-2 TaxID=3081663 RepID=UPI00294A8219|nr:tetratricopeptide repeat protein [Flavobacterium sp. DG1-102-2]MDV6168026.1 tetratricopeptide repeat protein [Flavobacterium sp. DG1-102-2]
MKFLFLLFLAAPAFSQEVSNDVALYNSAQALQEATYHTELQHNYISGKGKVKEKAAATVKELNLKAFEYYNKLVKEYPDSDYYADALYQKGMIEFWYKSKSEAKESFTKILSLLNNDSYKNQALVKLATIAIEEKNYSQAIDYLDESKKHHKFYTCGNEIERDKLVLERLYIQANNGLKK